MATESITVSALFPVPPERIYQAWLSSEEHSRMTGGVAEIEPHVGGRHSARDGTIQGEIVRLDPGRRIVQTWRTTQFPESSPPSRLEIMVQPAPGGTRVILHHRELPEGQGALYEKGWHDFYFGPMTAYFGGVPIQTGTHESTAAPAGRADNGLPGRDGRSVGKNGMLSWPTVSSGLLHDAPGAYPVDEETPLPRDDEDTATDDLSGIIVDEALGPAGKTNAARRRPAGR